MFQLTPIMGITLAIISLSFERLWSVLPDSPYFSSPSHTLVTMLILFTGGIIAFCMVWAEFTLISNTSALTFMVAGTFKEIVTVGAAVLFLHERFTLVNAAGLVVLIVGVVLFNYLKYQKLKQGELRPIPMNETDFGLGNSSNNGGDGGGSFDHRNSNGTASSSHGASQYSQSKNQYGDTLLTLHHHAGKNSANTARYNSNAGYRPDLQPRGGQSPTVEMVTNGVLHSSSPVSPGSKPMFILQEEYGSGEEGTPGGSARVLMSQSSENEVVLRRQRSL